MPHTRYRIKKEDKHWGMFWKQVSTQKSKQLTSYKVLRETVLHNFVHGQRSLSINEIILNSTFFPPFTFLLYHGCSLTDQEWLKYDENTARFFLQMPEKLCTSASFRATQLSPITGYALTLIVLEEKSHSCCTD